MRPSLKVLLSAASLALAIPLSAIPASAASSWAWTHKQDVVQGGWFEVIVSKNTQNDAWWAEVVCSGGTGGRQHKTRLGGESISTGHSTAHCPKGFSPYEGYIDRSGYTNKRIWTV